MARYVEGAAEKRMAAETERLNGLRTEAVEKFGKPLGKAFFEYAYSGDPNKGRGRFAQVVVEALEIGTRAEKINAVAAFLEAAEIKATQAPHEHPSRIVGMNS